RARVVVVAHAVAVAVAHEGRVRARGTRGRAVAQRRSMGENAAHMRKPETVGELAKWGWRSHSVKDEMRENLIARVREGQPIFPGVIGYDDSVIPQIVNAILSRHDFILLGLRGQAKTRILR